MWLRVQAAVGELGAYAETGDPAVMLGECERAIRRLQAVKLRVIAAADRAAVAGETGLASTGAWVAATVHADQGDAARVTRLAGALDEASSVTGQAVSAGVISLEHAAVVVRALDTLPEEVGAAQRGVVEGDLVEKASRLSPEQLRRAARRALAAVEPDEDVVDAHENATVTDEEDRARAKSRLTLHDNEDGTTTGHFTVPTLYAHILVKVLDAMTAPRRARPGATRAQAGDPGERTDWAHARGLAFCDILQHLPTDRLPTTTAATVIVTLTEDQLRGRLQAAGLDTGHTVSAGEARRIACGAGLVPAVLDGQSHLLYLGRTKRLFTHAQRTALALRHQTCAATGCERPFAWCELHHRRPWHRHGDTDLDNAVPLCRFHHRRIHDPRYTHQHDPDGITFCRRDAKAQPTRWTSASMTSMAIAAPATVSVSGISIH